MEGEGCQSDKVIHLTRDRKVRFIYPREQRDVTTYEIFLQACAARKEVIPPTKKDQYDAAKRS